MPYSAETIQVQHIWCCFTYLHGWEMNTNSCFLTACYYTMTWNQFVVELHIYIDR